jgi:membrane protein DedA with SNARE-associated domain
LFLRPGPFLAGINQIPLRPFVLGSGLSGLAWTLTVGLGAFFAGPSLIAQLDTVGRWMTVTAAVAVGTGLVPFRRRRRSRGARERIFISSQPKWLPAWLRP